MAEKKNYWKAGTISVLVLFLGSLGVNITDISQDEGYLPYTCESPTVPDMLCYKLSRVNDRGIQSYCYYDRDESKKFKKCTEGWKMLEPDNVNLECPRIIAYTDDGKYYCNLEGECVNENLEVKTI